VFVLPREEGLHREIAAPGGPLLVLLRAAGSDEPTGRVHRREDADHAFSSPDLFNQTLDHVGGPEAPAVLGRKLKHRGGIIEAVFKNVQGLLGLSLKRLQRCFQSFTGGRWGRGGQNGVQPVVHPITERRRCLVDHVAPEVGLTPLPDQPRERRVQGLAESLVGITGRHAHTGEAAGLQPLDKPVPTAFGLAVGEMQPEELALPIGSYSDAQHDGGRPHGALATDLDLQCVKEHERVGLPVQRALRPGINLFVEPFAETRDG